MTNRFLRAYAIFIGLTSIPLGLAAAASLPFFGTGAGGTTAYSGTYQQDLNNLVLGVNTNLAIPASQTTAANGSVATVLGSLGPTGSHTTVQEWLQFTDSAGVIRWVPAF